MIQQKVVITPATPETSIMKDVAVCDICLSESGGTCYRNVCTLCKRDICTKCSNTDRDDYGDYPSKYCLVCYELKFNKYDITLSDITDKHEKEIREFMEKIKEESLSINPNKEWMINNLRYIKP